MSVGLYENALQLIANGLMLSPYDAGGLLGALSLRDYHGNADLTWAKT